MLSTDFGDENILNAVAASISTGSALPIMFTEGGRLESAIQSVVAIMEEEEFEADANKAPLASPPKQSESHSVGTGTGFIVSTDGHVLTNAHVVAGCQRITVDGQAANVIAESELFDLAIIVSSNIPTTEIATFSNSPAKLNSDITVAGYPFSGLLAGLNVTRGSVSSLKGVGGDATRIQITAPVQPGNSGGPVVAADGSVVGVVVARLNDEKVADL